ncbi:MAG: hypothetical protein Kow00114_12860 [Kiloniellaceae bacterium]
MSRTDGTSAGTVLRFPAPARSWQAGKGPVSRAEIDRAVARGRGLQGEALRAGLRRAARFLIGSVLTGGCLRGLRPAAHAARGLRQPCC